MKNRRLYRMSGMVRKKNPAAGISDVFAEIAAERIGFLPRRPQDRLRLLAMGAQAVLIKGGHGQGAESIDYLSAATTSSPRLRQGPRRDPPFSPVRLGAGYRHFRRRRYQVTLSLA
jgi:hypothetical protein